MKKTIVLVIILILTISIYAYGKEYSDYKVWYKDGTEDTIIKVQFLSVESKELIFHHANWNDETVILRDAVKKYKVIKRYKE